MKNNLIKLSLIGIFTAGITGTMAIANDNQQQNANNGEQEQVIQPQMGPGVCPYEPHCPEIAELVLEDDQ